MHVLRIVLSSAVACAALVVASSAAEAVTYVPTPSTGSNAYSVDGYRAVVRASGFKLPAGYRWYSRKITVKRDGQVIARNVTAANLRPGSYTVLSTFKYGRAVAYRAYRDIGASSFDFKSCVVIQINPDGGSQFWDHVMWRCRGWDNTVDGAAYCYVEWDESVLTGSYQVGAVMDEYDSRWNEVYFKFSGGSAICPVAYTAYRYGPLKVAYRSRTHYVNQVWNPPEMSLAEFRALQVGDSHSRVKAIVGSGGTLSYESTYGSSYTWPNTAGYIAYVWFDADGNLSSKAWYT